MALALLPGAVCADDDILFQVSTIDALLQGVFDGFYSFEDLKTHGDFGIGTFDSLDGEMIALDGHYYQIKADGVAYPEQGNMTSPFSTVTYFQADQTIAIQNASNFTELSRHLDEQLPSRNAFYAVRIDGTFPYIKTRSVPRQEKPFPRWQMRSRINLSSSFPMSREPLLASGHLNSPRASTSQDTIFTS